MDEEYLAHYGVIGMKWGIRHDPKRAYSRASKKYTKLKNKADKKTYKAKQATAHTPSRLMRITDVGVARYDRKMRRINAKNASAARAQLKAERWLKNMEREFSKIQVSELPDTNFPWNR